MNATTTFGYGLILGSVCTLIVFAAMRRENAAWKRRAIAAADEAADLRGENVAIRTDYNRIAWELLEAEGRAWHAETAAGLQDAEDEAIARSIGLVDPRAKAHMDAAVKRLDLGNSSLNVVPLIPSQRNGDAS